MMDWQTIGLAIAALVIGWLYGSIHQMRTHIATLQKVNADLDLNNETFLIIGQRLSALETQHQDDGR